MTPISDRLRALHPYGEPFNSKTCDEAADIIGALVEALEASLSTLEHTREFMLRKHGTTNPAREEALALSRAAIARARGAA